jgi:hypothetical protein
MREMHSQLLTTVTLTMDAHARCTHETCMYVPWRVELDQPKWVRNILNGIVKVFQTQRHDAFLDHARPKDSRVLGISRSCAEVKKEQERNGGR